MGSKIGSVASKVTGAQLSSVGKSLREMFEVAVGAEHFQFMTAAPCVNVDSHPGSVLDIVLELVGTHR